MRDIDLKLIQSARGLELDLMPLQGLWTEQQYLKLTDQTNHLVEFDDGSIEVLPTPTEEHQAILEYLEYGVFKRGETPRSALLEGLSVVVDDVLDAR